MIGIGTAAVVLLSAFASRAAGLPRWLDRPLPVVDVAGEALTRKGPHDPPAAGRVAMECARV